MTINLNYHARGKGEDEEKTYRTLSLELYTLTLLKTELNQSGANNFFKIFREKDQSEALKKLTELVKPSDHPCKTSDYDIFNPLTWKRNMYARPEVTISLHPDSNNSDTSESKVFNPSTNAPSRKNSYVIFRYHYSINGSHTHNLAFCDEEINKLVYKLFKPYSFVKSNNRAKKEEYESLLDEEIDAEEIATVSATVLELLKLVFEKMKKGIIDRKIYCGDRDIDYHILYEYYFDLFLSMFHLDDEKNGGKYKRINSIYEVDNPKEIKGGKKSGNSESSMYNVVFHNIMSESKGFPTNSNGQLPYRVVLVFAQKKTEDGVLEKDGSKKDKQ